MGEAPILIAGGGIGGLAAAAQAGLSGGDPGRGALCDAGEGLADRADPVPVWNRGASGDAVEVAQAAAGTGNRLISSG